MAFKQNKIEWVSYEDPVDTKSQKKTESDSTDTKKNKKDKCETKEKKKDIETKKTDDDTTDEKTIETVSNVYDSILDLEFPGNILVVGKTGSGKTSWIKHMCRACFHPDNKVFSAVYVMCTTAGVSSDYTFVRNKRYVFKELKNDFIEQLLERQEKFIKQKKTQEVLLILDDIIGENLTHNSPLEKVITSGRHYHISVVMLIQHITKLPPVVRNNCKYIFVLDTSIQSYRPLFDLNPYYIDEKEFRAFLQKKTKNYHCVRMSQFSNVQTCKLLCFPITPCPDDFKA